MVANTLVAVEQRKSGRDSRAGGTCNKLLNSHSLLREIYVGGLLTTFSVHMWFSKQYSLQNITATNSKRVSFKSLQITLTVLYQ